MYISADGTCHRIILTFCSSVAGVKRGQNNPMVMLFEGNQRDECTLHVSIICIVHLNASRVRNSLLFVLYLVLISEVGAKNNQHFRPVPSRPSHRPKKNDAKSEPKKNEHFQTRPGPDSVALFPREPRRPTAHLTPSPHDPPLRPRSSPSSSRRGRDASSSPYLSLSPPTQSSKP